MAAPVAILRPHPAVVAAVAEDLQRRRDLAPDHRLDYGALYLEEGSPAAVEAEQRRSEDYAESSDCHRAEGHRMYFQDRLAPQEDQKEVHHHGSQAGHQ